MRRFFIAMIFLMGAFCAQAQNKFVERSTDVLSVVPTLTGVCLAVVNEDKKGAIQLGLSTATAVAANYILEAAIKKDRPDGTGHHAFPSTHTLLAFNGATYIMKRYGWKWGVPAYIVSSYVAWGRTYSKKHDWWDVVGGAAIGTGAAFIYTRKLKKDVDISISPAVLDDAAKGIDVCLVF